MKDYRPYAKRLATLLRDVRVLISPEHPWPSQ